MSTSDIHPLRAFVISEQITAPHLRTTDDTLWQLSKIRAYARENRKALIFGDLTGIPVEPPDDLWTSFLGDALINEDVEALEAIGLIWFNHTKARDNLIERLGETLKEANRMDLMRPAIAALHDVAAKILESRVIKKQNDEQASQTNKLKELVSSKEWSDLGADLAGWASNPWSGTPSGGQQGRLVVAKIVSDILTTIPDTQDWIPGIFLAILTPRIITNPDWLVPVEALLDLLNDRNAGIVLQGIADVAVYNILASAGSSTVFDRLAERVVIGHPNMKWADWLGSDRSSSVIDTQPTEQVRWRDIRGLLTTDDGKDFFEKCPPKDRASCFGAIATTYECLIRWNGIDKFSDVPPAIRQRIERLINSKEVEQPLPILRAALDLMALREVGQGQGRNDTLPSKPRARSL